MYCDYWQFAALPFESDDRLDRYVPVPESEATLLKLRYILEGHKAGGVLVGHGGTGKSFLVRKLAAEVRQQDGDDVRPIIRIVYPRLSPNELVAQLAVRLGADPRAADSMTVGLDRLLDQFGQQLHSACSVGRDPIIILDDAHTIDDPNVWRTLRLLMNYREEEGGRFTLLLIGQNELLGRINEHPELASRLSVQSALPTLSRESVEQYVSQRIAIAGGRNPFAADAIMELANLSHGVPRRINELADLALLVGVAVERQTLSKIDLRVASNEMQCVATT